ncbi:hypothetical protein ABE10_01865 [Bacillus toyonensis]|nr:hypothetical protein [Bacillus toyonensis]
MPVALEPLLLVHHLEAQHGGVRPSAGHDRDDVVHLQRGDRDRGEHDDHRAADPGEGDVAEPLPGVGAVKRGGLQLLGGNRLDRGGEDHHREAGLRPDEHDQQEERVQQGLGVEPGHRLSAEERDDRVEQSDLVALPEVVHELPDDAGPDERDRDGHEDQDLQHLLTTCPVDEHRVGEADRRREGRRDQRPDEGVDHRPEALGVGEGPDVVLEPHERLAALVEERLHDGADRRVDQPEDEQGRRRSHEEDELHEVARPLSRTVVGEEQQPAGDQRDRHHVQDRVLIRPQQHERQRRDREARDEAEPEVALPRARRVLDQQQQDADDGAEDHQDDRDLHQRAQPPDPDEEAPEREAQRRWAGLRRRCADEQRDEDRGHRDRSDDDGRHGDGS